MKRSLLEIYALAVCFVTVICFAITLGIGIYDVVEITHPDLTLWAHQYKSHQTNEAFTADWPQERRAIGEDAITKQRETSYRITLAAERRSGIQSGVRVLIVVFINIALFLTHWRLAKQTRKAMTE